MAFLDRALFTSYTYNPTQHGPDHMTNDEASPEDDPEDHRRTAFQVSLPALLETLQIFGLEALSYRGSRDPGGAYNAGVSSFASGGTSAFDRRVLGMSGICRLSYPGPGAPLGVILEETGVTTTCELVTYEPDPREEIPLHRERLALKVIMRAAWLHDAIVELASTNPTRLVVAASPTGPQYLAFSAAGALGSATVEFSKDPQLLETFQVARRTTNAYKFSLIKNASRAMAVASKVSIRGDDQGVLSFQFMIESEGGGGGVGGAASGGRTGGAGGRAGGATSAAPAAAATTGGVSFVDYRFVPFLPDEAEGDDDGNHDGTDDDDDGNGDDEQDL